MTISGQENLCVSQVSERLRGSPDRINSGVIWLAGNVAAHSVIIISIASFESAWDDVTFYGMYIIALRAAREINPAIVLRWFLCVLPTSSASAEPLDDPLNVP